MMSRMIGTKRRSQNGENYIPHGDTGNSILTSSNRGSLNTQIILHCCNNLIYSALLQQSNLFCIVATIEFILHCCNNLFYSALLQQSYLFCIVATILFILYCCNNLIYFALL